MNRNILIVSTAILFFIHALEEYLTGFPNIDQSVRWLADFFFVPPTQAWLIVQFCVAIFLVLLFLAQGRYIRRALWLVLLVIVFVEITHPVAAIAARSYYPGLISSFAFIPLGWLIYKQGSNL
ncbi:MAG TPA: HXXEE domain-containing protein [Candidatus Paceibacterota bacterium]